MHARSRRDGPLVALRAGGLRPDELAAAIDRAARGSLLLADIDDASPDLQARLLHALDQPGPHAPRWLTTARGDAARLRPELRHRLGVFPVHVPPLRERREDIVPLLHRCLHAQAAALARPLARVSERALGDLLDHDYPGNVSELWALLARAAVLAEPGECIEHFIALGIPDVTAFALGQYARAFFSQRRIVVEGMDMVCGIQFL
mgnify:CR=1 FL=1